MRYKVDADICRQKPIRRDWWEGMLILWSEDDARPPGREQAEEAFERISGHKADGRPAAVYDENGEDWVAMLYPGGWVKGFSFDGGFVGVVVKDMRPEPDISEEIARREEDEAYSGDYRADG